eukprot:GHRR01014263.1.p1 GENE.GHRR01014263.1~~GHRR01014263.1.p1  ORF type:complete len:984 (+),score=468.20 GHRR01014263.1:955-3906(+)
MSCCVCSQTNLLDLKKCTAIGIRMARLKVPWPDVGAAILALDPKAFAGADDIMTVQQCLPSEDEKGVLQGYLSSGKPLDKLSEAEQFVISLMRVPRASQRLRAMSLKFSVAEKVAEATAVFSDHIAACKELQSSRTFKQLLAAALAVGNFLNHGTRLGNAPGFRIKGLNKMHDSRSMDGKSTMLQVLARQLLTHGEDIGILSEELAHVTSSKLKISWQEAADMLATVEAAAEEISQQLEQAETSVAVSLAPTKQQQQQQEAESSGRASPDSNKQANDSISNRGSSSGSSPGQPGIADQGSDSCRASPAAGGEAVTLDKLGTGSTDAASISSRGNSRNSSKRGSLSDNIGGGEVNGVDSNTEELVSIKIIVDNFIPVMTQVLSSIKVRQGELGLLRDRAASAWEGLLKHFGETKQSCPSDTDFWADMQLFVERFSAAQKAVLQEDKDAAERKERLARVEAKKAAAEAAKKASSLAAGSSRKKLVGMADAQQQRQQAPAGATDEQLQQNIGSGLRALAQKRVAKSAQSADSIKSSQAAAGAAAVTGVAASTAPTSKGTKLGDPMQPGTPATPVAKAGGMSPTEANGSTPASGSHGSNSSARPPTVSGIQAFGSPVTPEPALQQQQQQTNNLIDILGDSAILGSPVDQQSLLAAAAAADPLRPQDLHTQQQPPHPVQLQRVWQDLASSSSGPNRGATLAGSNEVAPANGINAASDLPRAQSPEAASAGQPNGVLVNDFAGFKVHRHVKSASLDSNGAMPAGSSRFPIGHVAHSQQHQQRSAQHGVVEAVGLDPGVLVDAAGQQDRNGGNGGTGSPDASPSSSMPVSAYGLSSNNSTATPAAGVRSAITSVALDTTGAGSSLLPPRRWQRSHSHSPYSSTTATEQPGSSSTSSSSRARTLFLDSSEAVGTGFSSGTSSVPCSPRRLFGSPSKTRRRPGSAGSPTDWGPITNQQEWHDAAIASAVSKVMKRLVDDLSMTEFNSKWQQQ